MSSMNWKFGSLLVLAVCISTLVSGSAFGQAQDGNLVGSVLDSTGAVVPNAMVEVENIGTGVKNTTTADDSGFYRFNNLLIGNYRVTASAAGLSPAGREVLIELNKTTTANVTLAVGGVTTEVNVVEAQALIDTTTSQVINNYDSRLAADLPFTANPDGGGILNLALIGAGVSSSGGFGTARGPAVGGQRPRNNNFTIEGIDNNRKDVTGPILELPGDSIAEFTVLQNVFNAEFGHSAGGQFNIVLRDGTNEVHGTAYEYFQNRKLNALDESFKRQGILTKQRYDQNTVGGSVGGPIKKNKLFYFGGYDYNPLGQAATASSSVLAPTAAGYAMLNSISGLSKTNLDVLKKYLPAAATQSRTTTVSGVAIPIGIIPVVGPSFQNTYRWLASANYNQSDRNQWRGRYINNKITTINTDANLPVFWVNRPIQSHLVSISQFHTFSSNVANEFRIGYNRYKADFPLPGNLSFPGLDIFPNIQISNDLNLQLGPQTSSPQSTIQNTYQAVDNVSWFKGRHDFKFGLDLRNSISPTTFIQRIRGDYQYSNLERYLLDYVPDRLAQRNVGGKPYAGNSHSFYFYGADNWKVSRNLTFNLGLRYDFNSVSRSMKEFAENSIADVPGVLTFFAPKPQKTNFGPRFGFAYTPGTTATTTIRGGLGLAYDQIFDNVGTNARPPQATSTFDRPVVDVCCFLGSGGITPSTQTTGLTPQTARAQTSSWLPDQKLGYSINWTLGVQRVIGNDYTVEVRYLGNKGVHLLYQKWLNRIPIVTANHNLPVYFQTPSQATLDALTLTRTSLQTERDTIGNIFAASGFNQNITAYAPDGNSIYHGMATEVKKRFARHVQFTGAYTWSHLMDDSSAEVNSTVLSPRRPEDFFNARREWASSLLDHRHRFSMTWILEAPWFSKASNALMKNVVGNWQFAGTYVYESPQFATVQSGADANLNGDAATDRSIINVNGVPGTSSDVTPLCKSTLPAGTACGAAASLPFLVAYKVIDPTAYYVLAQIGTYTTGGRNTLETRPIDNFDLNVSKLVSIGDRYKVEIRGDFFNAFNHPQYTPGRVNNVISRNRAGVTDYLTPGNPKFARFDKSFQSNARQISLAAKFKF